jgi:2-methylisocitrate lyase-like PEP mutase family enzyme
MVAQTHSSYHRAGVAALPIEDQIQMKRYGHFAGKELVDTATFTSRIAAATQARDKLSSPILIVARTDALQTSGFDDAVRRLQVAVAASADIAFLEGLTTREEGRRICGIMRPTSVLLNMAEHGATPSLTPKEARELGFRIVSFPFAAIAPAYAAIRESMMRTKETGITGLEEGFMPKKLFEIVGLNEATAIDAAAGGVIYSKI